MEKGQKIPRLTVAAIRGALNYCNRFMLYSKEYIVLLRCSCVRLVKPLAFFWGMMFGSWEWGF